MKRILILSFFLCFFLCGCKSSNIFSAEEPEYMVSSIGFRRENSGEKTVFLESIVINAEDTEAEKKIITLEGKGETLEEAYRKAKEKAVQPLNLSHCGVVIINENTNTEFLEEICDFCYEKDPINLAAFFIYAPDVKKLLKEKPIASVSVGFDIMSRLSVAKEITGKEYKNRFYQIESLRRKGKNVFDIPLLKDGIFVPKGD